MTIDLLLLEGVRPLGSRDEDGVLVIVAEGTVPAPTQCPVCGKPLYKHGRRTCQYADTSMHGKPVRVEIERQRYRCKACGKVITPNIPSLDDKRIATKRLVQYIESQCFSRTFTAIANETGLALNTIKNIARDYMARLDREYVRETPRIMGVDELKICGNYCAVITNLEMSTAFDILSRRTKDVITPYFRDLKDKEKIEWVVLDMWGPYKDVIREQLPHARMVIDKYHVVEKASVILEALRIEIQNEMEKRERVKMKKHLRWALLRRNGKRTPEDEEKLSYIRERHPDLADVYDLAESFHKIFELDDRSEAEAAFEAWAASVMPEYADSFGKVARMVNRYHESIFNYFDLKITNAFTEACNGILKLANRMGRGYGFDIIRGRYLYDKVPSQTGKVVVHGGKAKNIVAPDADWGDAKVTDYGRYVDDGDGE